MKMQRFHAIIAGETVIVAIDWSLFGNGFFMHIFKEEIPENLGDDYVFSHLEWMQEPYPKTLEPIVEKCEELGISIPRKVLGVLKDQESRMKSSSRTRQYSSGPIPCKQQVSGS
jgi:hypothetical protein